MAKLKKPDNETPREIEIRRLCETIANIANRSEKTSWSRKMDNMVKLLMTLQPVEDAILDLIATTKTPIMDDISVLRSTMVSECIHPFEYLVVSEDNVISCKFCDKKIVGANVK